MSDDTQLTRYVHQGEPIFRIGDLCITITIDPAIMRRATEAAEQARRAMVGMAVPLSRLHRPDERNVIDLEPE